MMYYSMHLVRELRGVVPHDKSDLTLSRLEKGLCSVLEEFSYEREIESVHSCIL